MALVEQYKKKSHKKKTLKRVVPLIRWGLLALGVVFLIIAIKHSIGNLIEIIRLLDNKVYTGAELQSNYAYLTAKYGETIIGNGGAGFQITFVDVKHAFFSGIMIMCSFASIMCFIASVVLGKWILPMLVRQMDENSQEMVNLATLEHLDKENKG